VPLDPKTFETLLQTSRALRRRRRERLAQLIVGTRRGATASRDRDEVDARSIRKLTGLSQPRFAELLDIELATLRNWEQGRRSPTGPARALLRAVRNDPVGVIKALIG
jgi:putative transcriptional regulator